MLVYSHLKARTRRQRKTMYAGLQWPAAVVRSVEEGQGEGQHLGCRWQTMNLSEGELAERSGEKTLSVCSR